MAYSILLKISLDSIGLSHLGPIICSAYTAAYSSAYECSYSLFIIFWTFASINALPNWGIYWTTGTGYTPGAHPECNCINYIEWMRD